VCTREERHHCIQLARFGLCISDSSDSEAGLLYVLFNRIVGSDKSVGCEHKFLDDRN